MKYSFILLLIILINFNCQKNKESKKNTPSMKNIEKEFKNSFYFDESRIKDDKFKVKYFGDSFAFSELILYYSYNKSRQFEIIPYALTIVEKYEKYEFCTSLFNNLVLFYSNSNSNLENNQINNLSLLKKHQSCYATYFLELGATNSDSASMTYLEKLYRNGIVLSKNIKKADS